MSKLSDIEFRYTDLGITDPRWPAIFERIRQALRATRDAIVEREGLMKIIRDNVPPTAPPTAAALPAASAKLRGQVVVIDMAGVALDTVHICLRDVDVLGVPTYAWKQFTVF